MKIKVTKAKGITLCSGCGEEAWLQLTGSKFERMLFVCDDCGNDLATDLETTIARRQQEEFEAEQEHPPGSQAMP